MQFIEEYLRKNFKVVSFDMDGTLIKGTTSNLFYAKLLDVENEVIDLENLLREEKIDSGEFMVKVSVIMKGLTINYVKENFNLLPVVKGIKETVDFFKRLRIMPIIVTTSNILFAECFKEEYGFERVYGTKHKILEGGKIGRGIEVCSKKHKIQHVNELVLNMGGTMKNVIAIGDSFSDIPLFSEVACSIAYNYDPLLADKANIYVKSDNIYDIIFALDKYYRQQEKCFGI